MATVSSKDIVQTMVDNDGVYPGDPPVLAIYEYNNGTPDGPIRWVLVLVPADAVAMARSPYVFNIKLLWSKETGKVADPQPPKTEKADE